MPKCDACGSLILFGGSKRGSRRFCNDQCAQADAVFQLADSITDEDVAAHAGAIHAGDCPVCAGPGPVDLHHKHEVYSVLVMTNWKSIPMVCCRGCATRGQLTSAAFSLLAGWWGIPWGFLLTPVQLARNVGGLIGGPSPHEPSDALKSYVRRMIAFDLADRSQASG
jgi:hypothetical protein